MVTQSSCQDTDILCLTKPSCLPLYPLLLSTTFAVSPCSILLSDSWSHSIGHHIQMTDSVRK